MRAALAVSSFALACAVGCIDDRLYTDEMTASSMFGGNAGAALRGDVGQLIGLDTLGTDVSLSNTDGSVYFSGNVPHQSRAMSSVFIDVAVTNAARLPVGASIEQNDSGEVSGDVGDDPDLTPVLSVYICPNGEGVSGSADRITVTRTGEETFSFVATSSVPEQNLDIDLVVASEREMALLRQPAP